MKSKPSFPGKRRLFFKKNRRLFLALLFSSLLLFSCTGGGIGGSGAVTAGGSTTTANTSVGPITALGSIFVTGIEFKTTGAAVTLDGVSSDAKDLQVGMVVKVEGSVDLNGKTGTAKAVVFAPNAAGPITGIDLSNSSLEVLGQTVLVDGQTIIAGLPGNTPALADLAINDPVEISGLAAADGNIQATRITRVAAGRQPEVLGRVSSLTNATFKINALDIDYANAILSNFGSLGIQSGDFVEVKGNLTSPTTLLASAVEKKSPDFQDGNIEIAGFIDSLSYSGLLISGFDIITPFGLQSVALAAATEFSGGQLENIKVNARIVMEGVIKNNIITAKKLVFF